MAKKHEMHVHYPELSKKFACKDCDAMFHDRSKLKLHAMKHSSKFALKILSVIILFFSHRHKAVCVRTVWKRIQLGCKFSRPHGYAFWSKKVYLWVLQQTVHKEEYFEQPQASFHHQFDEYQWTSLDAIVFSLKF